MSTNETTEPVTTNPARKISLARVLDKTVSPSAWVEYKEGIFFELRYLSKSKFRQMAEDCTEHRYNAGTKVREPKMDTTKFMKKFVAASVSGWRGVTMQALSKLVEIDISGYSAEELKQELDFSVDELIRLIDMVMELDPFIQSSVMDIKVFRPALEDELKN